MAEFVTAITCMDGRIHLPVIRYLQDRCKADFVDLITEAGPSRILASNDYPHLFRRIQEKTALSVSKHGSQCVAIIGHHDCAGNPAEKETHLDRFLCPLNTRIWS
ncbi:MAG: hypothetical protein A2293_01915 [Elusimicrobia bacterium RIFOXYB2_FULL_49_7]|nr:MAG: hypothetical protein A2293_01915 [Elusimicrobia bacterium RIFOXYB2_FULL_49_7]